ncbi:MAG: protein kinase [Acidimicrobiia bacterium]
MTALDARYELGHRIGGGGMADVVEAYDRKLDRRVAVKLLRDGSSDPRARERFVHEAQAAARFTHPNVVAVYDVGETGGQPYLVMELIEGRTLKEVLAEHGPLPVEQALAAGDALLAALGAAHVHGLVHRDVKPANMLIGANGRVKLADFGIAKAIQGATAGLTATGEIVGTPAYLSPEQVEGRDATPRTDLYAVGVVLYEMLAGTPPFQADQALAVALAHRDDPVPPLEAHRADLPAGLSQVIGRALEKDPERRFTDAGEMRNALKSVRNGTGHAADDATIVTALPGATQTLPAAPTTNPPPATNPAPAKRPTRRAPTRRSGKGVGLLVFIVAAVVGLGAGLLMFRGDSPLRRGERAAGVAQPLGASVPTLVTTTTFQLPTTVDGLIAFLAAAPDAFGERGSELLERLLELREDSEHGRDAEHLAQDIEGWVEDGELDPTMGALALQILGVSFDAQGEGGPGNDGD